MDRGLEDCYEYFYYREGKEIKRDKEVWCMMMTMLNNVKTTINIFMNVDVKFLMKIMEGNRLCL